METRYYEDGTLVWDGTITNANPQGYYIRTSAWDPTSDCNLSGRMFSEVNKLEKGGLKMRSLYKVYVVDPRKLGTLLGEKTVIAETEEQALLKAGVVGIAEKAGLELEQVDTQVWCLGTFIRPRKETQRVKMVKDEDE